MKVRSQNTNDTKPRARAVCVSVSSLTVGAKIVGFDRPWSESGESSLSFTITGAAELSELRAKHETVYVEAIPDTAPIRAAATGSNAQLNGADQPIVIWDHNDTGEDNVASSTLRQRLKQATSLFKRRKKDRSENA